MSNLAVISKLRAGEFDKISGNDQGKMSSIGGLYRGMAKKVCYYVFGDFFYGVEKDTNNAVWILYLKKEIPDGENMIKLDKDVVDNFLSFWKAFKVKYVNLEA